MGLGLLHAFNQAPPRWVRGLSTVLPTPCTHESRALSRGSGIRGASLDVPTPARDEGAGAGPLGATRALPARNGTGSDRTLLYERLRHGHQRCGSPVSEVPRGSRVEAVLAV